MGKQNRNVVGKYGAAVREIRNFLRGKEFSLRHSVILCVKWLRNLINIPPIEYLNSITGEFVLSPLVLRIPGTCK